MKEQLTSATIALKAALANPYSITRKEAREKSYRAAWNALARRYVTTSGVHYR